MPRKPRPPRKSTPAFEGKVAAWLDDHEKRDDSRHNDICKRIDETFKRLDNFATELKSLLLGPDHDGSNGLVARIVVLETEARIRKRTLMYVWWVIAGILAKIGYGYWEPLKAMLFHKG